MGGGLSVETVPCVYCLFLKLREVLPRIEKRDKRHKNGHANRIYYFQSCFNLPFPPSIWQLKQNSKPVSLFSSGSSLGTVSFFRRLKHRKKSELDTASFPPSMGVDDCAFSGTGSSDKTGVYFPFD